jgi:small subunit ribosomal protein S13
MIIAATNKVKGKGNKNKGVGVVYVLGVPLKSTGRLCDELKNVYGINTASIDTRLSLTGLLHATKVYKLKRDDLRSIEKMLNERYLVGPDLRREEYENIQRHRKIGTYKGVRIRAGLPVRGQRTSTNAKTAAKLNKQRCKM